MTYRLLVEPSVHSQRQLLPGNIRQRLKKVITDLGFNPRPTHSKILQLDQENLDIWEVRRLRIEQWRVIYAIDEECKQIVVLAIRKRPPYNYQDLKKLLENLE